MEPIEVQGKGKKVLKEGWVMSIETGCWGIKRKRLHCQLLEEFDDLWQKTFVLTLKKNKNVRKPQNSVKFADGDTVEIRSQPLPLLLAIVTITGNLLIQCHSEEDRHHWLDALQSCGLHNTSTVTSVSNAMHDVEDPTEDLRAQLRDERKAREAAEQEISNLQQENTQLKKQIQQLQKGGVKKSSRPLPPSSVPPTPPGVSIDQPPPQSPAVQARSSPEPHSTPQAIDAADSEEEQQEAGSEGGDGVSGAQAQTTATKKKKQDVNEYSSTFVPQAGMSKSEKEKAFFEEMAKQKNTAEEARVAGMGDEERSRYMAEKREREAHDAQQKKMLQRQMRTYNGGAAKGKVGGGRGRGRGRGKKR